MFSEVLETKVESESQAINENDIQGAADAILMWNKPEVLINRRKRERALFLGA